MKKFMLQLTFELAVTDCIEFLSLVLSQDRFSSNEAIQLFS